MNSEQARVYIEKLKTIREGSTRAANKALRELAELLAENYAQSSNPPGGESLIEHQTNRKKTFLLSAGFIKVDDLII